MADSNTPDLRTVWFGLSPRAAAFLADTIDLRFNLDEMPSDGFEVTPLDGIEAKILREICDDIRRQVKDLPSAEKFHKEVMGEASTYTVPDPEEALADLTHQAAQSQAEKVAAKMAKAARKAAEGTSDNDA